MPITNQILPEVAIYEKRQETQKQRKDYGYSSGTRVRANNRRATNCRKVQVIEYITEDWPPTSKTRNIKTFK
jgi:hypothetical protein